jgi:hypothetical protein
MDNISVNGLVSGGPVKHEDKDKDKGDKKGPDVRRMSDNSGKGSSGKDSKKGKK